MSAAVPDDRPPNSQPKRPLELERHAHCVDFSGDVDDPDNWQPASLNFPMTLGDRLYTASGSRLKLQTEGGAIYLAPETDLAG